MEKNQTYQRINSSPQISPKKIYTKLQKVSPMSNVCNYSMERCEKIAPLINEINVLKKETDSVILAHSYVAPEIIYFVADYTGDSYKLSIDAKNSNAKNIIFCGVRFMAETAKILNSTKNVFSANLNDGCSLADSINGEKVSQLRKIYPEHTFMCYINTTAEVKAVCDVCVTSSNVFDIVENHPNDRIVFLPDKLMGENILVEMKNRGVQKEIILYDGDCYVHKKYDEELLDYFKSKYQDDVKIIAHPECDKKLVSKSDYVGSTSQIMKYVQKTSANHFLILSECGLISRMEVEMPSKNFVGNCIMCKYMKGNSLKDVLRVLKKPTNNDRIEIDEEILSKANQCVENMFVFAKI